MGKLKVPTFFISPRMLARLRTQQTTVALTTQMAHWTNEQRPISP